VKTEYSLASGSTAAIESAPPTEDAQPTILFVPGYTGSKEDFLPLLRPLATAGYRSVAIDQRGQYESAWAKDEDGYSIDSLAADVCDLVGQLRPVAASLHLVGHSFGGLVTRVAVLAEPKLFDSFTLMGSGPGPLPGLRRAVLDAGETVLAEQGMQGLWAQLAARAQADPSFVNSSPALREFLKTRFLANDPVGLRVMGQALRQIPDSTEQLAAVALPKLVLHGVRDDAWPPAVQADMARRLAAEHVVIGNAAHSPAVENPSETARALLAFWAPDSAEPRGAGAPAAAN